MIRFLLSIFTPRKPSLLALPIADTTNKPR